MLRAEKVGLTESYHAMKRITKQLDQTNVKILTAMWKHGPRNLLEVSRQTKIPFTSVYHRVGKLEANSGRVAFLVPKVSKLGMVGMVVLLSAKPGLEEKATAALKIPGFWRSIAPSEPPFTHHSVHAVPVKFVKDFRKYLQKLTALNLVTMQRAIPIGDYVPNFPNFSYYNANTKDWKFEWKKWLVALRKSKPSKTISDPADYPAIADIRDLLIVKELEKNARTSFADMSPVLGISLQGVKYHYDKKLVPSGIVKHFAFDLVPYPPELSAYHEIMLDFTNKLNMNRFFSILNELFFVVCATKALGKNVLVLRTYIPQSQTQNMFEFFSELAKARILMSYSSARLNFSLEETNPIPHALFDKKTGWNFELRKYTSELSKLR
jgi:DNA-binding Lrp family transcriptional regulator